MNKLLEAALQYAEAGIPVFPCVPKSKNPLLPNGLNGASLDFGLIRSWWAKWPTANIGIALGNVSGLMALDVDFDDGCDVDFMKRVSPGTVVTKSPTGNFHVFYQLPGNGIKHMLKLEAGLSVRSQGGYVIAPPSEHPEAPGEYAFVGKGLGVGEVEECPEWICEKNRDLIEKKTKLIIPAVVKRGERNSFLFKAASKARTFGKNEAEVYEEISKIVFDPPVPDEELRAMADRVCRTYPGGGDKIKIDVEEKDANGEWRQVKKKDGEAILALGHEILDERFKLLLTNEATLVYQIIDSTKKELQLCLNEDVVLAILHAEITALTGVVPAVSFCERVFEMWKLSAVSLAAEPISFCWKDEDAWTFKKLDFSLEQGSYSAWSEFVMRLSAPDDFMAFIWSIFEPASESRQYLYLHDPIGEGGKSRVIKVLGEIFGNAYATIGNSYISGGGNRWLMGLIYGKRLIAWPDCKNTHFCMSEVLRNITSGDDVSVEFKGKQPFTTKMYVKLVIASNHEPTITSGSADVSRLIRIDVSENRQNKNDPDWPRRLKEELGAFLFDCREIYRKKCPNNGNISLGDITHELGQCSTESIESVYEEIVARNFQIENGASISIFDWQKLIKEEKLSGQEIGNLKTYLRQLSPNIFIGRQRVNGKRESVYRGFRIKSELQRIIDLKQQFGHGD